MNEVLREVLALPPQASTVAREIDMLHYFVIVVTMMGASAVAAVALYFTIKYRASRSDAPVGAPVARFTTPILVEVPLIGMLVVLFVAWWVIGVRQFMHLQVPPDDAMEVYVVGKQWMWKFTHGSGRETETRLYVPAGRPVKLVMTSRDVIHSFFVPAFRVKQDVIPGRYTVVWFEASEPGTYPLLCTEYCGTGHSTMRGEIVVLPGDAWERWTGGVQEPEIDGPVYEEPGEADLQVPREPIELVELGVSVATSRGCLRCHTTDGSPHIGPSFAGMYLDRVTLTDGRTIVANEAYLTESMMDPLAAVHAGYDPVMPSYRGQLDPTQAAALLELIRSLGSLERSDQPGRVIAPPRGAEEPYPAPEARGRPSYPVPTATPQEPTR